ncbi:MAG TPA: SgcJ/EcaC family oxidoreductase [Verrucomicrobiae bacterium]|nr:SgcJ/EcaC family oxidoreductase [Verrucomicrobiae bacterium]
MAAFQAILFHLRIALHRPFPGLTCQHDPKAIVSSATRVPLGLNFDIWTVSFVDMKTSLILLMATSAFLCGCATTSPTTSQSPATSQGPTTSQVHTDIPSPDNLAAIRQLYASNAAALNAGDTSSLARLYEKDAIQFPPNSPALIGWEAIQSELESELEGIKVAATIEIAEVIIADQWTFARGTYRMVTTPQSGGEQTVAMGNWLDILRRQPDSSWKIARSTWTIQE